jgi:hypothetical protein
MEINHCKMRPPSPPITSAIEKTIRIRFESSKTASPVTPSPKHHSQSSQLNHNSSTTIDRTRTQQSTWERAQKQHTYRSRSYRRRQCLRGGGLVRQEPSIRWGLLSTWSTYCCRQIFDGNESSGLAWASHGLSWSSSPIEASQKMCHS